MNVAQAGKRTNNPAKEYFQNVFGITACFPRYDLAGLLGACATPSVQHEGNVEQDSSVAETAGCKRIRSQSLISSTSVIYSTPCVRIGFTRRGMMADRTEGRRPVKIDKDLLAILCCPDTKQDVSLADAALIDKLNEAVSRGQLRNRANKPVTESLDGGLIRGDRKMLYPIREDIPVMLIEEGIPLEGMIE
jgi:uncharacterized protein YbaR (Trm112 family)